MDGRQNNGGARQGAGRKQKNKSKRSITFRPSEEVLIIWDGWEDKTGNIEKAVKQFKQEENGMATD